MLHKLVSEAVDDRGAIDPRKVAGMLDISVNELARLLQVSRNTLAAKPVGARANSALTPLLKILTLAAQMTGSESRAKIWFKFNPIISLGTKTAMEHVAEGHADDVLAHMEDVLNGVYA